MACTLPPTLPPAVPRPASYPRSAFRFPLFRVPRSANAGQGRSRSPDARRQGGVAASFRGKLAVPLAAVVQDDRWPGERCGNGAREGGAADGVAAAEKGGQDLN